LPAPRFHRRPADRPEELLTAALEVFGSRGFRATTLEEVAARAGVSKGTVYLYFESKDDLLRAVVEKKVVALLESAEEVARSHSGTATELLITVVHRMWDAMSHPEMISLSRLVQAELTHFPGMRRFFFDRVIQRHRRLLRGIAARGVARREFRRSALIAVPRMVPPLVMQLNQNRFLFGSLDRNAPDAEALRDAMLDMVLAGVRAAGSPARRGRVAKARSTTGSAGKR
jgi:AcrR family transcriptional regulator